MSAMKNILKRAFGVVAAAVLACLITAAPLLLADVVTIPGGSTVPVPLTFALGGTGLTTAADDTTLVSSGSAWVAKAIPDSNTTGVALQYDTGTNAFSAATLYQIGRVAADVSNSSGSTWADVTGLTFAVSANTTYSVNCNLTMLTAATTTALQIGVNGPASPTAVNFAEVYPSASSLTTMNVITAYDTAGLQADSRSSAAALLFSGTFENGANAGTLAIRIKSEVDTSAVTIQRGSFCVVY